MDCSTPSSHGGAVVTLYLSPEVCGSNPGPYVGKLVVAYRWSAVQNLDQLYVLVSSAYRITHHDMSCIVLKVVLKPK